MIEVGKIVEIKGDIAVIELELEGKCGGCSIASFCEIRKQAKRSIEAHKIPGIKVGDRVKVEIQVTQLLKGVTLLFLIPAICFVVGAAIGDMLIGGVIFPFGFGALFLAISFFILHLFDKRLAEEKNKPKIIAIL